MGTGSSRLTSAEWKTVWTGVMIVLFLVFAFVLARLTKNSDVDLETVTKRKKGKRAPRKPLTFQEFVEQAKSGDIVAVSYNSTSGKMVKVFVGSVWTHCGLVLERKNEDGSLEKVILEIANYRAEGLKGAVIKPLSEWVYHNRTRLMAMRGYESASFPTEKVFRRVHRDQMRSIKPDFNPGNWLKTMFKRKYGDEDYSTHEKYYCSEYITLMMQEFGVIKRDYYPDGYKPWELLYGDLPLLGEHKYGSPAMLCEQ